MGQTLVEKIISQNVGHPVKAGDTVVVNVDFAALHDGSGPQYLMQNICYLPMNSVLSLPGK